MMVQPLIGVDYTTVICCGLFTVDKDNWKGVIALTDGVKRTVVYVVGGTFSLLKQAAGSLDGWKKLASVIAPIAALTKFGKFELVADALEAISAQFDTFKLLQGGMSWVNIGDDFFKKDFIEKSKSKHNNHGENYVACAKRVLLIAVNTLKLLKFGNKIGVCDDVVSDISKCLGGIPVMPILLAGVTGVGLIGNGLTFWTISNDKDEVNEKINRFLDNQLVTPGKTRELKTKLSVLLKDLAKAKAEAKGKEELNFEVKSEQFSPEEELSGSEGQVELVEITHPTKIELSGELHSEEIEVVTKPEDEYFATYSYTELKLEIALKKNEMKKAKAKEALHSKGEEIKKLSKAIEAKRNENEAAAVKEFEDQRLNLILDTKIAAEYLALKAEVHALKALKRIDPEIFKEYKNVQLHERMSELDQKKNKELRDFVCNLITIPGTALGLIKELSGLGAIMDLIDLLIGRWIHVDEEDATEAIISAVSLITGGFELGKFLYEENHKEEQKKISVAQYAATLEVA